MGICFDFVLYITQDINFTGQGLECCSVEFMKIAKGTDLI